MINNLRKSNEDADKAKEAAAVEADKPTGAAGAAAAKNDGAEADKKDGAAAEEVKKE